MQRITDSSLGVVLWFNGVLGKGRVGLGERIKFGEELLGEDEELMT